jgi:hypothetical protein
VQHLGESDFDSVVDGSTNVLVEVWYDEIFHHMFIM